jgi:hypothetical protein
MICYVNNISVNIFIISVDLLILHTEFWDYDGGKR